MVDLRPRKRFGQHFLTDMSVLEKIVMSIQPGDNDVVVEIGPGKGALTAVLLQYPIRLTALEIDRDLVNYLHKKFAHPTFTLIQQDILKTDLRSLSQSLSATTIKLIGNLPYNISTPLIFHILPFMDVIGDMTFMVQKEVADRLMALPNSKAYGKLTVMAGRVLDIAHLFDVPPEVFHPPPKVMSSVIKLSAKQKPVQIDDDPVFSQVVSAAFSQRRKTLRNALKHLIGEEVFQATSISATLRAENLSIGEFAALANGIS